MGWNRVKALAASVAFLGVSPGIAGEWVDITPADAMFTMYSVVAYTSDKLVPGEGFLVSADDAVFGASDFGRRYEMRLLIHADGGISGLRGVGIGTVNGSATWVCKASGDGQSCEDIGDGTIETKLHSSCFDAPEGAIALMNGAGARGFDCNEDPHDWMLIMLNFARRAAFDGELTGTNPEERIFVFADSSNGSNRYSSVNFTVDPVLARVMKFDRP